jgi:hypothetical protein
MNLFSHFLLLFEDFSYICTVFRKRHRHIAHLSLSNHHLGKENEQNSKYAEVALYSADFSIAYLGLVVSLREIMAGLRYSCD